MSEDFINLEKKPAQKKDTALSILVIILLLVFVFGFVTLREYSAKDILSTASEKIIIEVEEILSPSPEEKEKEEEEKEEEVVEEPVEVSIFTEETRKGEGLTHLSRRAITSYMNEEGLNLSSEERVYIEDYVQKRIAPEKTGLRYLEVGEEVEISRELIKEGVEMAENLTPSQIENLGQYAKLVSF